MKYFYLLFFLSLFFWTMHRFSTRFSYLYFVENKNNTLLRRMLPAYQNIWRHVQKQGNDNSRQLINQNVTRCQWRLVQCRAGPRIVICLMRRPNRIFLSPQPHNHAGWAYIAVAQLVKALRYKPEGRAFDSRWCHWTQPLTDMSTRNISWEVKEAGA
jgi:hypothetical protein